MLSSDKGKGGAAKGGQLRPERPPPSGYRGGNEGATAPGRSSDPESVSLTPFPRPRPALPAIKLEMTNLELLHHFTTATYQTISTNEDVRELWRLVLPQIAFSKEFLMHAMLAMSALHLSFLRSPDKSYVVQAAHHHGKALGSLRTAFSALDPEHVNATFATSSITAMYVYACPPVVEDKLPTAPTWIPLFRGICATSSQCWEWVRGGELAPLFIRKKVNHSYCAGEDFRFPSSLFDLSRRGASGEPDPEELEDDNVLGIYRRATEELKLSWDLFRSTEPRVSATFKWPATMSDEFVRFIEEQRPRALVLLAHHCVLIESLEEVYWWAKGRGVDEIKRIEGVLEEKWKRWLDWPIEKCKISKRAG